MKVLGMKGTDIDPCGTSDSTLLQSMKETLILEL